MVKLCIVENKHCRYEVCSIAIPRVGEVIEYCGRKYKVTNIKYKGCCNCIDYVYVYVVPVDTCR